MTSVGDLYINTENAITDRYFYYGFITTLVATTHLGIRWYRAPGNEDAGVGAGARYYDETCSVIISRPQP